MNVNDLGSEPFETEEFPATSEIIADELRKFKAMLYTHCGHIERTKALIDLIAKEAVKYAEKSPWYEAVARDLFGACSQLDNASSTISNIAGIIGQPSIREIDLSNLGEPDVPQSNMDA